MKLTSSIKSRINQINSKIEEINTKDINPVECNSTWESVYKFDPITYNDKFIWFKYWLIYEGKVGNDRITLTHPMANEDLRALLTWINGCIRKGITEHLRAENKRLTDED